MKSRLQKTFLPALAMAVTLGATCLFFIFTPGPSAAQNQTMIQSHRSYQLDITSNTKGIGPGQPAAIKYKVKNERGELVKEFAVVHEKIMHLIVVRKDLQQFQHLHPDYNQATGEFTVDITFPGVGPYRIFPDFTPGKSADNLPVTLEHDIAVGDVRNYKAQPVTPDTAIKKAVDGYEVTYAIPRELRANSEIKYTLTVAKGGQAVTNLETYLGALGHSVILKAETLDFIHTHAESKQTGPNIAFATSFPAPGIYKTFTQFQHQGKVVTTDYVISVAADTSNAPPGGQPKHGGHQ